MGLFQGDGNTNEERWKEKEKEGKIMEGKREKEKEGTRDLSAVSPDNVAHDWPVLFVRCSRGYLALQRYEKFLVVRKIYNSGRGGGEGGEGGESIACEIVLFAARRKKFARTF